MPVGITHKPVNSEGAISIAGSDLNTGLHASSRATTGNKRKYRRHPKVSLLDFYPRHKTVLLTPIQPDDNAPDRPPSAYVLFSNRKRHPIYRSDMRRSLTATTEVREHLKGRDLTFTAIAKTVGERWQVLAPDEKATYESRSQAMKDRYYAQLADYKKTEAYGQYQNYLADFKAKHEPDSKQIDLTTHKQSVPANIAQMEKDSKKTASLAQVDVAAMT